MNFQWKSIAKKIDARTERERALLFLIVVALLFVAGMQVVISPLLKQQKLINSKLQQNSTLSASLSKELTNVQTIQASDVNANVKQQIAEHKKMLAQRDQKLKQFERSLVAADKIDALLESILKKNKTLRLVSLKSFPVVDMMNGAEKQESSSSQNEQTTVGKKTNGMTQRGLFKHEVEIVVEGNYLDMLDYLKRLEAMPERLYWSRSALQVQEYPKSRLSLRVFTLSLERKWLDL